MGNKYTLLLTDLNILERELVEKERSQATIEKYLHDAKEFILYLDGRELTKTEALGWKKALVDEGYSPSTVNCRIAAINKLFCVTGYEEFRLSAIRVQRKMFRDDHRDLNIHEYRRLVDAARKQGGGRRLMYLIETICATGIRVSEVKYITVEAAQNGCAQVSLKGKVRTILIPEKLSNKLLRFAKQQGILSGEIFVTKSGKSLSRGQIWAMMKNICASANVEASKVFPHNLRHLFARIFYQESQDIVMLADVLGHSDLSTTRIYLISTGSRHRTYLEKLCLVC